MTAFARTQSQNATGSLVCELRSINHRYLEISMLLPDALRVLEMPLRDLVRQYLKRGKVECVIRYHQNPNADNVLFNLNLELAQELCKASEKIANLLKEAAPIYPTEILRFQGVMETKEADLTELENKEN